MRQLIAIVLCILLPSAVFTQTQTSAVKNSFQEVTSHLDPGGNLYLYLSTEEWLSGLSDQIAQFRNILNAIPATSAADKQNPTLVFSLIANLVKQSGIEEISGFGMSSVAVEKGLYHSKAILHHYRGNNTGYLWSVFGRQPHTLDGLDQLPANTAFASFSDLDLSLLWSVVNKEVEQSGTPDVHRELQAFRDQFAAMTGGSLEKILASLGGECGLVFTLDENGAGDASLPGTAMQIPQAGLMLACKVKDDTIFDSVDATFMTNPQVIRTNRGGLRMRTMPPPVPTPITLRPSIARSGDYFFVASNDALIEAAVAVKAGTRMGLKSTDEFQKLSRRVPEQGNSFTFRSRRIAETMARLQSGLLANNPAASNLGQAQLLTNFFGAPGTAGTYSVGVNTDEGFLFTGNGGQNPATTLFLLPTMAVTLIVATIAIPSLLRSRQAANEASAVANLRTIAAAEVAYSSSSRGNYAGLPTLVSAGLLDSRFIGAVSGYEYTITVSGRSYTAMASPITPNNGRYGYLVMTDGVVRYSRITGQAPPGLAGEPVQ